MKTPMSSSIKLDKDEKGKSIYSTMYRGMIESHLSAVKQILRYFKGTMDIGLWYPKSDNFELIGFSDADFAGCRVERKNTSDTCHFLGHSLVLWHSKKQNSVALSTAEAKYIAGFGFGTASPPSVRVTTGFSSFPTHLGFWVCDSLSTSLVSFIFAFLMVHRRETAAFKAQGKRPIELSQPTQTETHRNTSISDLKASSVGWLATSSYYFRTDFPDSGVCILFEGYIWTRWPDYFHR
ncbi:Copia protein [Vitis vinifera]|uniref:Copia protein n=1 Tax=Vitis vinifera TaxID=29760 RepID=A0A438K5B1_VITVI|nr:Copia protein [Vitis vinifera]